MIEVLLVIALWMIHAWLMSESGNGIRNCDTKFVVHKPQQPKKKNCTQKYKKYSKEE